jgi:hypothetical protein
LLRRLQGAQIGNAANQAFLLLNGQSGDAHVTSLPGQNTKAAQAFQKCDFGCVLHSYLAIFRQKAFHVNNELTFL